MGLWVNGLTATYIIMAAILAGFLQGCAGELERSSLKSPNALYGVAERLHARGEYEQALKFYHDALHEEPSSTEALIGLARTYYALERFKEAEQAFSALLKIDPQNIEGTRGLGKVYLAQHKADQGIKAFSTAQAHAPDDAAILNGLGICHDLKGEHATAQKWYKQALSIQPDHWGYESNLGLSYALAGNYEQGLSLLKKAESRPQATARERHNLALAYGLAGQLDKAEKLYSMDLDATATQANLAYIHSLALNPNKKSKDILAAFAAEGSPPVISKALLPPPSIRPSSLPPSPRENTPDKSGGKLSTPIHTLSPKKGKETLLPNSPKALKTKKQASSKKKGRRLATTYAALSI